MAKAGNYYYNQLNKEQQRAYYAMKEGLLNLQDSFLDEKGKEMHMFLSTGPRQYYE